jgi:hypothetical protein
MFIGHYAVAYALKPVEKRLSLGWLFLAVSLVDILWSAFILLGIEEARIVEHAKIAVPYDFVFYPFSHSLTAALFWAAVTYAVLRVIPLARAASRSRVAAVMAVAVVSHWILDFIVHEPELSLWGGDFKVGLGLWDYPLAAYAVESLLFAAGVFIYFRNTHGRGFGGRWGMGIYAAILFLLFTMSTFGGSAPPSMAMAAIVGLVMQFVLIGVAGWLDAKRQSDN